LSGAVHGNAGSNRGWGYRKDGNNHPFGASILKVEANVIELRVGDSAEDIVSHFRRDGLLVLYLATLFLFDLVGREKVECRLADSWLDIAAPTVASGRLRRIVAVGLEIIVILLLSKLVLASLLLLADIPDAVESKLRISSVHRS